MHVYYTRMLIREIRDDHLQTIVVEMDSAGQLCLEVLAESLNENLKKNRMTSLQLTPAEGRALAASLLAAANCVDSQNHLLKAATKGSKRPKLAYKSPKTKSPPVGDDW